MGKIVAPIAVILLLMIIVTVDVTVPLFTGCTVREYKYVGIADVTPKQYSEYPSNTKVLSYEDNSTLKVYVNFTDSRFRPELENMSSRVSTVDGGKVAGLTVFTILGLIFVGFIVYAYDDKPEGAP